MDNPKSFLSSLFDTSFSHLIVPKLIRVFFLLGLVGMALSTLSVIISAFSANAFAGVLALLFSPIIYLGFAVMVRIYCELIIVQFEIQRNIAKLTQHVTGGSSSLTPPPVDGQGVMFNPSGPSGGGGGGQTPSIGSAPSGWGGAPAANPAANPAAGSWSSTPAPAPSSPASTPTPSTPSSSGWGGNDGSSGGGWS